ncbi:geobacillin-26 family protein [Rossellomorea sp. NPDC071047]|uniref:geobacillin-26 family protein n=1 Tax=Rossellomorea sp. NPDC071047 TaxID=3390675 RepID=UPI003CFD8576
MKKRLLILFTMLCIMLPVHIDAASPFVIGEGDASGYQYTVIKGEDGLTWKIGYQDHQVKIEENEGNRDHLDRFRIAVNDLDSHQFGLILSISYLIIVGITTRVLYKKKKHIPRVSGMIIACLAFGAMYYAITSFIGMQAALEDVGYYYVSLTDS